MRVLRRDADRGRLQQRGHRAERHLDDRHDRRLRHLDERPDDGLAYDRCSRNFTDDSSAINDSSTADCCTDDAPARASPALGGRGDCSRRHRPSHCEAPWALSLVLLGRDCREGQRRVRWKGCYHQLQRPRGVARPAGKGLHLAGSGGFGHRPLRRGGERDDLRMGGLLVQGRRPRERYGGQLLQGRLRGREHLDRATPVPSGRRACRGCINHPARRATLRP